MCVLQQLFDVLADNAFRFPDMFTNVGVAASAGVTAALIVGVSILPTMLIQWRVGQRWRGTHGEADSDVTDRSVSAKV